MLKRLALPALFLTAAWNPSLAQQLRRLTLAEAQQIALQNHPRIGSASLLAQAAKSVVAEARSPYYPVLAGNFTSVGAEHSSAIAAGAVPTSSLYSRVASGVVLSQLVSDFGRTSNLADTARLRAAAQDRNVVNTRAVVLLEVDSAYYQALAANAVLRAAEATLENRRLTLRQVTALAQSSLRSTLDVRFAEVAVSEAELVLYRAENGVQEGQARLGAALGSEQNGLFELSDEPMPSPLSPDPEELVHQAIRDRPDLNSLQLNRNAAQRFAQAEKKLRYPTINLLGTAGALPATDPRLRGTYSAAAVNVNVPILNGGLFSARQTEAELRAQASEKDVKDLMVAVARDVRTAWLEANNAFRSLDVTARLVEQANEALRLAQARYDAGLGGIVELNQAQLSQLSAQIAAASAKYDYLSRRGNLDYMRGALR